jgi:hypothetical protein
LRQDELPDLHGEGFGTDHHPSKTLDRSGCDLARALLKKYETQEERDLGKTHGRSLQEYKEERGLPAPLLLPVNQSVCRNLRESVRNDQVERFSRSPIPPPTYSFTRAIDLAALKT